MVIKCQYIWHHEEVIEHKDSSHSFVDSKHNRNSCHVLTREAFGPTVSMRQLQQTQDQRPNTNISSNNNNNIDIHKNRGC
eukprot:992040-Amphidinium_carterae.1